MAVSDPAFPTVGDGPLAVSLAPNDRLPVGAAATFRVGHSGLLQSKLYAFDETKPGAIRDLATVADADIPVPVDPAGDTIILAMARQTAPFLERVKSALAASDGERRDLGKEFALRDKLLGQGRGIGANIQLIPPSMLSAKKEVAATAEAKPAPRPADGDLPLRADPGELRPAPNHRAVMTGLDPVIQSPAAALNRVAPARLFAGLLRRLAPRNDGTADRESASFTTSPARRAGATGAAPARARGRSCR